MTINVVSALDAIGKIDPNVPQVGDFNISLCDIEHGSGAVYNIANFITELHLFEDIERIGVTGWVQLKDDVNLIQSGIILGEELLWLKFETAGSKQAYPNFAVDYSKDPLYVHKVEEIRAPVVRQGGATTQTFLEYRLHFCSTDMITNDRMRISKTYQGLISEIIPKILGKDLQTKKNYECAETEGLHHYIAPNVHPFDAILELAKHAQAPTGKLCKGPQWAISENMFKGMHTDFAFFETSARQTKSDGGFFFMPLQRKAAGGRDFTITLQNAASTGGAGKPRGAYTGFTRLMLTSKSFNFTNNGDKWGTVGEGVWAAKHLRHNGVKKSYAIYEHDYLEHLTNKITSELSETPVYWPGNAKKVSEYPDAKIFFSSSSGNPLDKGDSIISQRNKRAMYPWADPTADLALLRQMQTGHMLGYQRIQAEMYGLSGLQIGKMCDCDFPPIGMSSDSPARTGIPDSRKVWPNRNNNRWMVSKLGHHLVSAASKPEYTTTVELVNTFAETEKTLPVWGALGGGPAHQAGPAGRGFGRGSGH